jgi:hypothetical protein
MRVFPIGHPLVFEQKPGFFVSNSTGAPAPPSPVITSITPGTDGGNPVLTFDFTSASWDNFQYQNDTDPGFLSPTTGINLIPGTVGGTQEINPFTPLLPGTLYYVRMRVSLGGQTSDWSNVVSATTPSANYFTVISGCIMQCLAVELSGFSPGDPVTSIPDTSNGGTNSMDQLVGTPTYEMVSSTPVVRFTNTDKLWCATTFPSACTVLAIAAMGATSQMRFIGSRTNNWLLGWWSGDMQSAFFNGDVHLTGIPTDTNFHVPIGTMSGLLSEFWWDNSKLASNSNGLEAPDGLGVNSNVNLELSPGDLKGIVVWNRVLSDMEIAQAFTIASSL